MIEKIPFFAIILLLVAMLVLIDIQLRQIKKELKNEKAKATPKRKSKVNRIY